MAVNQRALIAICFISHFLNAGTPVWNYNPTLINPTGYDSESHVMDIGDIDGDGRADLAVMEDTVVVFYRNWAGADVPQFVRWIHWGTVPRAQRNPFYVIWPVLEDLDGDNRCELFFEDHAYKFARIQDGFEWVNADSAFATTLALGAKSRCFGDADGDGDLDMLGTVDGRAGFLINDGDRFNPRWNGRLIPVQYQWGEWGTPREMRMADFDGDSSPDLLAGFEGFESNGHVDFLKGSLVGGTWVFAYRTSLGAWWDTSVALGDINGDGVLDILQGDSRWSLSWYEKRPANPNPVFRQTLTAPAGYRETGLCIFRNPDSDSLSLFIAATSKPSDYWDGYLMCDRYLQIQNNTGFQYDGGLYLGEGQCHMRPAIHTSQSFLWNGGGGPNLIGSSLRAADHDEWFAENPEFSCSFLFTYNEDGMDTTLFRLMPRDSMYQDPIEADLDWDWRPELLLQRNGSYRVFKGIDYIATAYVHEIDTVMSRGIGNPAFYRADVSDLTGDGRPDLIIGKWDGTLTFFENRGPNAPAFWREDTSFFSGVWVTGPAVPALADLDGDGDADLVVADGDGRLFSYSNDSTAVIWAVKDKSLPSDFVLYPNYPNPFNAATEIRYSLRVPEKIRIEVIDVLGRRVGTLKEGRVEAGAHMVRWNGTDDSGIPVPSGLYFLRLSTAVSSVVRKMTVIR